jgi:hypothetical protein
MHRTIAAWKQVLPSAVVDGSKVQCANVLAMALDDLKEMGATLSAIMDAAENGDADACHELARRALMVADLMQTIRTKG